MRKCHGQQVISSVEPYRKILVKEQSVHVLVYYYSCAWHPVSSDLNRSVERKPELFCCSEVDAEFYNWLHDSAHLKS